MKKILTLVLIFLLASNYVLAYSAKVYDKRGKLVGTIVKNGDKRELYDLNGKKLESKEKLYSPPGVPIEKLNLSTDYKVEYYKYEKWIIF